jgi:hypothetical protein
MKIGWLHYSIASQSGVETVICRSTRALLDAGNDLHIRFVGKAGELINHWLAMAPGRVSHADVPEMGLLASAETPRAGRLALAGRIEERLRTEIAGCETVVVENASVGAHPAFNLAIARLVGSPPSGVARFVFRVHDMVFYRRANFEAIKALAAEAGLAEASARHILFPDTPRTLHLTVSRADAFTLYTLGLESSRIRCLPNFVDDTLADGEPLAGQFRAKLEERGWARPGEKLLVYAVRAVPRKNLSEALLLVRLLNLLSSGHGGIPHAMQPEGPFRLIVPLTPEEPKFRRYTEVLGEFVSRNDFEATLGLGGLVAPRSHPGNQGGKTEAAFGVAELYAASAAAVTTSALEGFGFGFLEPWCAGRVAIGRRLPVVDDFIRAGMRMDHFYRRLAVDNRDFWWLGEPPAPLFAPVSNEFGEEGMKARLEFVRTLDSGPRLGHFLTENRWRIERMLEALVRPARLVNHNRERALEIYSPKKLLPRLQAALTGRPDPAPDA